MEIADSLALADRLTLTTKHLPPLTTARTPLGQLFQNLLGNALKHHDQPRGNVLVSAEPTNGWWAFVVSDDGPGIPENQRERVFEMFHTFKPRDEVEGSGMGLALVKKVVESFGGAISVHSA